MKSQKFLVFETAVFLITCAVIGLLILLNQSAIFELFDNVQSQANEISRVVYKPASY